MSNLSTAVFFVYTQHEESNNMRDRSLSRTAGKDGEFRRNLRSRSLEECIFNLIIILILTTTTITTSSIIILLPNRHFRQTSTITIVYCLYHILQYY